MTEPRGDESFEALYHSAPCGLISTTIDGTVTEVNETFLTWTGRTRAEILGYPFRALLDAGSRLFYETRQVPILHLSGAVEVSLAVQKVDGETLPVLISSTVISDSEQRPTAVRTALFDASARQEYERQLLLARRAAEQSETRAAALRDASSAFASSASERGLADALADAVRVAFAAVEAGVFLLDDDNEFRLAGGTNPLEEWIAVGPVDLGGTALRSREVLTLGDLSQVRELATGLADAMEAAHLAGLSVAPMLEDGVAVGIFVCWFAGQRSFDDQFVELQKALGRQAAQTLLRLRLQRQLERLALHDQLTGLANRILIQEEVNRAIAASRRNSRAMAVIFIDLDGFKAVNDELGHVTGDAVLRQVAERLRAGVRQHDTVGRFGGDEFIAICADVDDEAATTIAERIRSLIAQPFDGLPGALTVTASLGVAVARPSENDAPTGDGLLSIADDAMYRSKSTGKNHVTLALR